MISDEILEDRFESCLPIVFFSIAISIERSNLFFIHENFYPRQNYKLIGYLTRFQETERSMELISVVCRVYDL